MIVEEQEQTQSLEGLEAKLTELVSKLDTFATITETNFEEALIHIGAAKAAERWIESERDTKVRPLNEEVKTINARYKGAAGKWETFRTRLERGCVAYRTEKKRLADEQQRLQLEEARRMEQERAEALRIEREKLEKEEEAERIARDKADLEEKNVDLKIERAERELREFQESLPEELTYMQQRQLRTREERVINLRAEKAQLETVVIDTAKVDARREQIAVLEAHASVPVVAHVVEQVERTVKTTAGSVTIKDDKTTWTLVGWDQKTKKCAMDVVEPGVFASLPAEIQWLLKVSVLDVPALNQSFKNREKFPKPFGEVVKFGGSAVRGAK